MNKDDGKVNGSKVPMEAFDNAGDEDEIFGSMAAVASARQVAAAGQLNPENFTDPFEEGYDPEQEDDAGPGMNREDFEELRSSLEDALSHLDKLEDRVKGISNVMVETYNLLEKFVKANESKEGEGKKPAGGLEGSLADIREDLRILIEEGHDVNWPDQVKWLEEGNVRKIFAALDAKIAVIDAAGKAYSKGIGEATSGVAIKATIIAVLAGSLAGVLTSTLLKLL